MLQTSTDTDFESLIKSHDKVVVKYYADWCGSCKLFAPKFKRHANSEDNSDVLFLDVNAEENENARKLGGVDNLPFIATFKAGALLEGSATSKEDYLIKMIGDLRK